MPPTGMHIVPREIQLDIKWCKEFSPLYNGVTMMLNNNWSKPDEVLASDSCLTGGGAYIQQEFMHFEFPRHVLTLCAHINQLECVTLVVAIAEWAHLFTRQKLLVYCDNQVTVTCINSGFSHNRVMQSCLRYLHTMMAIESFDVHAVFLSSTQNRAADSLSHWHMGEKYRNELKQIMSGQKMKEVKVNSTDFKFLKF